VNRIVEAAAGDWSHLYAAVPTPLFREHPYRLADRTAS